MTEYIKKFICHTEDDTKNLARQFALLAKKGDVFALFGTLGVGKSTFSRYFIQFFNDTEDVPSPTFTLIQTYETQNFDIYHYDMYRLKQAQEAYELGIEDAFYQGVSLIEWSEKIREILPRNIWKIDISANQSERVFSVCVYDKDKISRLEGVSFD